MRAVLHARSRNVISKLDAQYLGLCKVVETRGSLLTLRKLDTQRVFTANHNAVRLATIARPAASPAPADHAEPVPPASCFAPPPLASTPVLRLTAGAMRCFADLSNSGVTIANACCF